MEEARGANRRRGCGLEGSTMAERRRATALDLTVVLPDDAGERDAIGELFVTAMVRIATRIALEDAEPDEGHYPDPIPRVFLGP